jgi:hypothetical protein
MWPWDAELSHNWPTTHFRKDRLYQQLCRWDSYWGGLWCMCTPAYANEHSLSFGGKSSPIHGSAATIHGNPITNGRRLLDFVFISAKEEFSVLCPFVFIFFFRACRFLIVFRKSFRNLLQLGGAKISAFAKLLPMNYTRTCLVSL